MAKLFYTIDEASAKLGKSPAELEQMVRDHKLEEFKMQDIVHFKRAAIDQLVVEDDLDLNLDLADDVPPRAAAGSGSGIDLAGGSGLDLAAGSGSGLDLNFTDEAPPELSASGGSELDLNLDSGGGGGGLDLGGSGISLSAGDPDTLGLADSSEKSSVKSHKSGSGGSGISAGDDLGLDLGLDLDPSVASGAAAHPAASGGGSVFGLADTGGSSRVAPSAASEASGSMAAKSGVASRDDSAEFPSARSRAGGSGSLNLETVGSGSGMLDLAGDSDQSTMGAALLEDPGDDAGSVDDFGGGADAIFADPEVGGDGGAEDDSPVGARVSTVGAFVPAVEAPIDSSFSGLTAGLMIGATAAIVIGALVVVGNRMGGGSALANMVTADLLIWVGALAGGTLIAGGIGFFVGRAIE